MPGDAGQALLAYTSPQLQKPSLTFPTEDPSLMSKKGKIADPHAEREAARYDNPIPSREAILELLNAADCPLDLSLIHI